MDHFEIIGEKIFSGFEDFSKALKRWKKNGDKVVFTNGCFDLVHRGHVEFLANAANLGDRLIVGLNSDASVTRIKGSPRPFVDENSRSILLASMFFVDAVVMFTHDTPEELISLVNPHILVKGKDYEIHEIAGHQSVLANGGEVITLDLVPGFSSSYLISKIKSLPNEQN